MKYKGNLVRILCAVLFIVGISIGAPGQTFTVNYTEEKPDVVLAVVSIGTAQVWTHYLGPEERKLLSQDPSVLDAQISVQAKTQIVPPPPVSPPPAPKSVRVAVA